MTTLPAPESHPRVLGVYAHPDDESFCTGGTVARYAQAGCDIMVVSATRGQPGKFGLRIWRPDKPSPRFARRSCVWLAHELASNMSSAGLPRRDAG